MPPDATAHSLPLGHSVDGLGKGADVTRRPLVAHPDERAEKRVHVVVRLSAPALHVVHQQHRNARWPVPIGVER